MLRITKNNKRVIAYGERDRQTDRQTDRQRDRETEMKTSIKSWRF